MLSASEESPNIKADQPHLVNDSGKLYDKLNRPQGPAITVEKSF